MRSLLSAALSVALAACPSSNGGGVNLGGDAGAPSSGADGGAPPGSDGGDPGSFASGAAVPDLPSSGGTNGSDADLVIDSAGVAHLAYAGITSANGVFPIRYGACASRCELASSWHFATVGDRGALGGRAHLAVGPQGRAHVAWTRCDLAENRCALHYATCSSACSSAANWQSGEILTGGLALETPSGRALAVDSAGHPRLAFNAPGGGLTYAACDAASCTAPASWTTAQLSDGWASGVSLEMQGLRPRLFYSAVSQPVVIYRECDGDCTNPGSWTDETGLFYGSGRHVSLRLTAQGAPRILFNQGASGSTDPEVTANDHLAYYGWCEADCGAASNWTAVGLPAEPSDGAEGASLALLSDGTPVLALSAQSGSALHLLACSDSCESAAGTWSTAVVDSSERMRAATPALEPTCSSGAPKAFWYPGAAVQLAVDGADRPRLVYDAYVLQQCGTGAVREALRVIRYAQ